MSLSRAYEQGVGVEPHSGREIVVSAMKNFVAQHISSYCPIPAVRYFTYIVGASFSPLPYRGRHTGGIADGFLDYRNQWWSDAERSYPTLQESGNVLWSPRKLAAHGKGYIWYVIMCHSQQSEYDI